MCWETVCVGIYGCSSLQGTATSAKDRDLVVAIVAAVTTRCGCDFTEDRMTDRVFQCFPSSPQAVTYHAQLHGTLRATVPQLGAVLQEWASTVHTLPVQFLPLSVHSFCTLTSSSPLPRCPSDAITMTMPVTMATDPNTPDATDDTTNAPGDQSSVTTIAISVGMVVVVVVIAGVIVTIIIAVTILRYRHSNLDLRK